MKALTLKNIVCTTMLVFLVVGCGKDKKKSSNPYAYYNPYGYSNNFLGGVQNPQALEGWANSIERANLNQAIGVQKKISNSASGCSTKTFLKFDFQFCNFSNISGGTPDRTDYVATRPNQPLISYPHINAIVNPVAPLVRVSVIQGQSQYGSYYEVTHADQNTGKLIKYIIDPQYPGAANPMIVEDNNLDQKTTVVGFIGL